jgi:hypothetical protein
MKMLETIIVSSDRLRVRMRLTSMIGLQHLPGVPMSKRRTTEFSA